MLWVLYAGERNSDNDKDDEDDGNEMGKKKKKREIRRTKTMANTERWQMG